MHHTFQFDQLKDKIYNALVEYCERYHDIEVFDGLTKEQMYLKLLDLPDCEFNNAFGGSLEIGTEGFFESKLVVKGYVTKLMEAAMAVSTDAAAGAAGAAAPRADEPEALKAQSNASDSKVDDLASLLGNFVRVSTSNHDDITSGMKSLRCSVETVNSTVEKERVERIAGQKHHKALIDRNTAGVRDAHDRIDDLQRQFAEALSPQKGKKPVTPTPRKKSAQAQPESGRRRSARKMAARKNGA